MYMSKMHTHKITCCIFRIIRSDVNLNSVNDSIRLEVKDDVRPILEAGREVELRLGQAECDTVR